MTSFDPIVSVLLAAVAAGSVLASLHVLARAYERERTLHDLKSKVVRLRSAYAKRLEEIAAMEEGVELVDMGEPIRPLVETPAQKAA